MTKNFININEPHLGIDEITTVRDVIKSGNLSSASITGGPNVQRFEKSFSKYNKCKYSIAVNSGTSALFASLLSLDIKHGDEVIVPSFTFNATAGAVVATGAKPVFIDINRDDYNLDPALIPKLINKKTKAIIPVHLYGRPSNMKEIMKISKRYGLRVIEDASQALGSKYYGRYAGTLSDVGCFSMYPSKVITSGEGGVITTNNKNIYERLQSIRNHGIVNQSGNSKFFGLNLRMPEIEAAISYFQLKKLNGFIKKRKINSNILSEFVEKCGSVNSSSSDNNIQTNFYLYTISISKNRDELQSKLNKSGIGANVYYKTPIHKMTFYKKFNNKKINKTNSEWASKHVLSLPIHPKISHTQMEFIGRTFVKCIGK